MRSAFYPERGSIHIGYCLLTILPVYFAVSDGFYLSVKMLVSFGLFAVYALPVWRNFALVHVAVTLFLLLALFRGDSFGALISQSYPLVFFLAICGFYYGMLARGYCLESLARWQVLIFLLVPISIILFMYLPGLESQYFKGRLAELVMGSDALKAALGLSNVGSDEKVGGYLYANGNWAATFCFVMAMMAIIGFRKTPLLMAPLLTIYLFATFATGSKTPLFLFFIVLIIFLSMLLLFAVARKYRLSAVAVAFTGVVLAALAAFPLLASQLLDIQTFYIRILIWEIAIRHFSDYVLLGRGMDYWNNIYAASGGVLWYKEPLPPHNYIFNLLLGGGIVPTFLVIAFVVRVIWGVFLMMIYTSRVVLKGNLLVCLLATLWVLAHSLISNLTFFGDSSIMVPMGLMYAYMLHRLDIRRLLQTAGKSQSLRRAL